MSQTETRADLCTAGCPVSNGLVAAPALFKYIYGSAVPTANVTTSSQTHLSSEEYRRKEQSLQKPRRTTGSLVRLHHLGKPHTRQYAHVEDHTYLTDFGTSYTADGPVEKQSHHRHMQCTRNCKV